MSANTQCSMPSPLRRHEALRPAATRGGRDAPSPCSADRDLLVLAGSSVGECQRVAAFRDRAARSQQQLGLAGGVDRRAGGVDETAAREHDGGPCCGACEADWAREELGGALL